MGFFAPGNLSGFSPGSQKFKLNAWRNNQENKFAFEGSFMAIETTLTKLKIIRDDPAEDCLAGSYTNGNDFLQARSVSCESHSKVICRKWQKEVYSCQEGNGGQDDGNDNDNDNDNEKRKKRDDDEDDDDDEDIGTFYTLDLLLNPILKDANSRFIALKRENYKQIFKKVPNLMG